MTQTAGPFEPIDLYQWRMREVERIVDDAAGGDLHDVAPKDLFNSWRDAFNQIRAAVNMPNRWVADEMVAERRDTEPSYQPARVAYVDLPENTPDDYYRHLWKVPLIDTFTGKLMTGHRAGDVALQRSDGLISVTGVPSRLATSDDARRLAGALMAAAEAFDQLAAEASEEAQAGAR